MMLSALTESTAMISWRRPRSAARRLAATPWVHVAALPRDSAGSPEGAEPDYGRAVRSVGARPRHRRLRSRARPRPVRLFRRGTRPRLVAAVRMVRSEPDQPG
jgi:hypothetical protein